MGGCHIKPRVLGGMGAAAGAALSQLMAVVSLLLFVMNFDTIQVQICRNDAAESVPMDFQLYALPSPQTRLSQFVTCFAHWQVRRHALWRG
jgi:hypothetical protein